MSSQEIDEYLQGSQDSSNTYKEDFSDSEKHKQKNKPAQSDYDEESYEIQFEDEADDKDKNEKIINENIRNFNRNDNSKENKNVVNGKTPDVKEDNNKSQMQQKLSPEQILAQSITQEELNKQQLGFLGDLGKFVEEKNKREELLEKIEESKGKKPQQSQRRGFERSVEKKIVPSDEEIQEILDRNQQNFLQRMQTVINQKQQNAQQVDSINEQEIVEDEDENQYYEEGDDGDGYDNDENLQVIQEAEHEESQLDLRSSQHNSSQVSDKDDGKNGFKRYQNSNNYDNDDDNYAYTLSSNQGRSPNKPSIPAYAALKALKRKQIEKIFHKEIAQISQEFQKKEELKQINDIGKLDISVDGGFEQAEEILQIADEAALNMRDIKKMQALQERMRYGCRKCGEQNNLKDRERLKEENLELKKQVNELTAGIQILKVQAAKNVNRSMNSSFASTESTASTAVTRRISELEFDKGKLQEHNVSLRQQITDLKESQTNSMKREKIVKSVIQKELGKDIRALQEKENKKKIFDQELQKKLTDQTNKLCELRLDLEKMVAKYTDQKEKLKEKDEIIEELRGKVKKLQFTKQLDEIEVLKKIIKKNDAEKDNLREEMALDNQIAELFPNSIVPIMHFLNICVGVEQLNHGKNKRLLNYLSTVTKPLFKKIRQFFRFCKDYVEVKYISKDIKEQLNQKAIVRATIKAWNKSPEIVSSKMKEQYQELKEIKERSIEMSTQMEILSNQNQLLEKDIEALKQRNQVVENKLLIDKNRLIQNTIIQLKHHSIEDEESNYLEELKDVVRVIGQGVPQLYSQEQKEELKRQQAIQAEKERQQKEKEEKEAAKLLEKQKKLELKQKQKEEQEAYEKLPHCKKAPKPPSAIIVNNIKAAVLKEKAFRVNSATQIKDNKQKQKNS